MIRTLSITNGERNGNVGLLALTVIVTYLKLLLLLESRNRPLNLRGEPVGWKKSGILMGARRHD
jgi:hypothetical protein